MRESASAFAGAVSIVSEDEEEEGDPEHAANAPAVRMIHRPDSRFMVAVLFQGSLSLMRKGKEAEVTLTMIVDDLSRYWKAIQETPFPSTVPMPCPPNSGGCR